jgi:hypothetical protein
VRLGVGASNTKNLHREVEKAIPKQTSHFIATDQVFCKPSSQLAARNTPLSRVKNIGAKRCVKRKHVINARRTVKNRGYMAAITQSYNPAPICQHHPPVRQEVLVCETNEGKNVPAHLF